MEDLIDVVLPECCTTCARYIRSYNDCPLRGNTQPWKKCSDYLKSITPGLKVADPLYLFIFEDGGMSTVKSITDDDKEEVDEGLLDIIKCIPEYGFGQYSDGEWNIIELDNRINE